jgi:hypothetical protein
MMKIDELKELTKCTHCNETFDVPMVLPCFELICKRHIENNEFKTNNYGFIKCPFCNDEHQIPEKIDLRIKKLIDLEVNKIDLGKKYSLAKQELMSLDQLVKEFELLNNEPESFIYDYFLEIKTKVNLRREELKEIIDLKYEAIMDDLKAKENEAKQEAIKMKQLSENITDLRCYFDGLMANLNNMSFNEKKYSEIILESNYCKKAVVKGLKEYKERLLLKKELEFQFETSNDQNILGDLIVSDSLNPIEPKCFLDDFESKEPICIDTNMEKAVMNDILSSLEYKSHEQYKFSYKLLNKQMKLGEKWYLINKDWYNKWSTFINRNNFNLLEQPGVINNDSILNNLFKLNDDSDKIKSNLVNGLDYYVVCQELWEYLKKVYGLSKTEVI